MTVHACGDENCIVPHPPAHKRARLEHATCGGCKRRYHISPTAMGPERAICPRCSVIKNRANNEPCNCPTGVAGVAEEDAVMLATLYRSSEDHNVRKLADIAMELLTERRQGTNRADALEAQVQRLEAALEEALRAQ